MNEMLQSKSLFFFCFALCVTLMQSSLPTTFAQTESLYTPGGTYFFDRKQDMNDTFLSPVKACPLTIEDALYDPYNDRVALVLKPGELFNSNKKSQLLEGARLAWRLQRPSGWYGPDFPDVDPSDIPSNDDVPPPPEHPPINNPGIDFYTCQKPLEISKL